MHEIMNAHPLTTFVVILLVLAIGAFILNSLAFKRNTSRKTLQTLQILHSRGTLHWGELIEALEAAGAPFTGETFGPFISDLVDQGLVHEWREGDPIHWKGGKVAPNYYKITPQGEEYLNPPEELAEEHQ
jgi:hypothetical protein